MSTYKNKKIKILISDFADSKELIGKKDFKDLSLENQNSLLKIGFNKSSDLIAYIFKNCTITIK